MTVNPTKQKVIDVAVSLFYLKGFHGTSVRDIAQQADVNVSLISYYFKSKQGLLEYAVTNYYELYLNYLKEEIKNTEDTRPVDKLKDIVHAMLHYKMNYYQLTSFIDRELTLDSTFVREMSVTYLAKENHLLQSLFESVLPINKQRDKRFYYMQLKGMLAAPYIFKSEWHQNAIADNQALQSFIDYYARTLYEWIDFITGKKMDK